MFFSERNGPLLYVDVYASVCTSFDELFISERRASLVQYGRVG